MATGAAILRALKDRTAGLPLGSRWAINVFDKLDLCKLTTHELVSDFGWDKKIAECVDDALLRQDIGPLAQRLGIELIVDRTAPNLIPGEGFNRVGENMASALQGVSAEQVLDEVYSIRHPEHRRNGH